MQIPKKHFPVVGLIGLVLVAAVGGSIYYYQFVLPHNAACGVPVHRVIFLSAIIQEIGGFKITGAATVNQTSLPPAANYTAPGQFNLTSVPLHWDNSSITNTKSIDVNRGDKVTVYMFAINSTDSRQYVVGGAATGHGHGFGVDGFSIPVVRLVDWGTWGGTTFTASQAGSFLFRCLHNCSDMHPSMTGSLVVNACG